ISLSSHIQVTSFKKEGIADYNAVIAQLNDTSNNLFVKEAHPFVQREAVIKFKDRTEGIIVKGVRNEDSVFSKQRKIVQGAGTLGVIDSSVSNIIIGNKLANKLNIPVGSKIFIIATVGIPSATNTPAVKGFNVVGIYESGLKEYDDVLLYTDLKDAQKLFSMGPYVTGIEIFLTNTDKIRKVTNEIKAQVDYPNNNARNVYQIYKGLFTWVELQKEPIPIVLGLIIIVAAINIIGFLLMLVLEKTETIGILKSLGAKNTDITFIFFFQGMLISLAGIISGNILGYGLCFLQLKYNLVKIPEIYYMSAVPLDIDINTGIVITVIAVLLSILVTVIPSYMASRLNPITSLRFK
ncbi:MAG: ABC transporter permease, partial [Ignavibacteria bacterium]|nr:ABC transporter permease [Ignavibacteria bacterium]